MCKFSSLITIPLIQVREVLTIMYLVKDYDDSGAAGVTDLQQYSTQTMWQLEMPMDEMA